MRAAALGSSAAGASGSVMGRILLKGVFRAALWSAAVGVIIAGILVWRSEPEFRIGIHEATTLFGIAWALSFVPCLAIDVGVGHFLFEVGAEGAKTEARARTEDGPESNSMFDGPVAQAMKTMVVAATAGLASIVVHAAVEVIAAANGSVPAYLVPPARDSVGRYLLTFAIQTVLLVAAYLMVGGQLPGRSVWRRGAAFGALVFLFGACLPLAPMALVFREPLPLDLALQGLIGGALVAFGKGIVFVVVWEAVARTLHR